MILLWLALATLLLPALWLLLAPLRRASAVLEAQRDFEADDRTTEQNLSIYRRRLASLEAARDRGDMDEARYEEDRLELERSLLEDTDHKARAPLKPSTSGRVMVPVVMVTMVLASLIWYQLEGAEGDLVLHAAQQEVMNDPDASLETLIERLEEQAERQPDNPSVWKSLAPLYRDNDQPDKAAMALERLIELEGRTPGLLAELAQNRFFAADRQMTDEARSLVEEARDQRSDQPIALRLLGIEAFDTGEYEQAIDYWRRATANMNDPAAANELREAIQVAHERMGVPAGQAQQEVAEGPGVHLRVSLDPDLASRVSDNDTVFVVARDMAGELPPLAVTRFPVSELPTTVVLDDSSAMAPRAKLSAVDEARLVVRVSSSGQATPQVGDLFTSLEGVAVGSVDGEPIEVVVDRIVE